MRQLAIGGLIKLRGCKLTRTGAVFDESLAFSEWFAIGKMLAQLREWSNWTVADFIIFGDRRFASKRVEALKQIFGREEQTYRNIASVGRAFPASRRRELPLTFSHHVEVAALSEKEQDKYLDLAVERELSCADLRELIRQDGREVSELREAFVETSITAHLTPSSMWAAQQKPAEWSAERRAQVMREIFPIAELYFKCHQLQAGK